MPHVIDGNECISCGSCAEVCPTEAISEGESYYIIDAELCIDCGSCTTVCPTDCLTQE